MILAAGTRVRFALDSKPMYLRDVRATVLHKQPGEDRYLVRVDNNPDARHYAGGDWCVHELSIEPVNDEWADEKGKRSAEAWMQKIAPRIELETEGWIKRTRQMDPQFDDEEYLRLVHPQLLWRFYYHLARLLDDAARGWETVYHSNKGDAE